MNDAFGIPQSVVVLGGTSDIARAVLERLGGLGTTKAVLAAKDPVRLEEAVGAARAAGITEVRGVEAQATEVHEAAGVVQRCFAGGDHVDMVLVAVGLLGDQEHDEHDPAAVAEVVTVNFTWPAAAVTEAARRLRHQGHGRIVVLSSVAGVRVRRANYVYGSSKAGLDGFCLGLQEACRGTGVAVQVVRPGFVHTKMTAGRPAAPFATTAPAVAEAVVKALGTKEDVVWVPRALGLVFPALALLPRPLWRRLPG